jgi:hypothetical protein
MKTTALPVSRQQFPSWSRLITRVSDFIALTKPRVMALAVFTAAAGLVWLVVMMVQVAVKRFRPNVERRLLCFALFWHTLDIVWVWLFTVVYLMGVRP